MLIRQGKDTFEENKNHDCDWDGDSEEVLAVGHESLSFHLGVVGSGEVVDVVVVLILSHFFVAIDTDAQITEQFLIIKQAPLGVLNLVDLNEHLVHCITIHSVVELQQKQVVKNTKKVEDR